MKNLRCAMPMLVLGLFCAASPFMGDQAILPDCDRAAPEIGPNFAQGPDCAISWVDNNQLQTIIWRQVEDDFQEASLRQGLDGDPVLTSSWWPNLYDVDRDGWLDLISFTRVGMVNGTFEIFLYDPLADRFVAVQPVSGHTLARDRSGYIVVTGRSGPGWTHSFYELVGTQMTFVFEVEPFGLGQSGDRFGQTCDLTVGYRNPLRFDDVIASGQIADGAAFFAHYCDTTPDDATDNRSVEMQEDRALSDRVPQDTAFYCVLEGGTHAVTVTLAPHGIFYAYGPLDGAPELTLDRPLNLVPIRPEMIAGPTRFGDITFTNGAYEYVISYSYDLTDGAGVTIPRAPGSRFPNETFTRGLVVYKDGDRAAPVFQRDCVLDRSYDGIFPRPDAE